MQLNVNNLLQKGRTMFGRVSTPTNNASRGSRQRLSDCFTSTSQKTNAPSWRSLNVLKPLRNQSPSSNGAVQQHTRELGQEPTTQGRGEHQLISRQTPKGYQYTEQAYLTARTRRVAQHFPTALGLDDFLNRLEIALFAYGFTGENCIGTLDTSFVYRSHAPHLRAESKILPGLCRY